MPILPEISQKHADLAMQMRRFGRASEWSRTEAQSQPTGIEPLDDLLPNRGVEPGTLIEWLSDGTGTGAGTLAFSVLRHLLSPQQTCVAIDPERSFSPIAWLSQVEDDRRMIVIHPEQGRDTLWGWEQALRCRGVAVVIGWLDRLSPQAYRRLKLAAETGGGIGLLLRPMKHRAQPSWADVRLAVQPRPSRSAEGRTVSLELVHCRGGLGGNAIELEIDDETGDVRLAPAVASPASARFAARA